MDDATTVYMYVSEAYEVLYVGVTGAGHRRAEQHRASKSWWPDIEAAYFVHFKSRADALAIEAALIRYLNPVGNTVHRADGETRRIGPGFVRSLKSAAAGDRMSITRLIAGALTTSPQSHIDALPTRKEKARAMRAMSRDEYMHVACESCGRRRDETWHEQGLYCPACWNAHRPAAV